MRTITKIVVIGDGLRRVYEGRAAIKFWATHGSQLLKDPRAAVRDLTDPALGVIEVTLGPKAINEVYKAIPAPEIKRIEIAGHKAI